MADLKMVKWRERGGGRGEREREDRESRVGREVEREKIKVIFSTSHKLKS